MTNQSNAIITAADTRTMLATKSTREIEEVTTKLMKLAQGNRRLQANEAAELAVASFILDANPFNGEIYHAGGWLGIMLGWQYYHRKGLEQLAYEDDGKIGQIMTSYRPATHEEAMFDPSLGDVAWTVAISDSVTEAKWLANLMKLFHDLQEAKIPGDQAWKYANDTIGPKPVWEASAVVYGSEDFEGVYTKKDELEGKGKEGVVKPQKWDRNERCKKRCLKWALKKRFANLRLPEGDNVVIDAEVREVADRVASKLEAQSQSQKGRDPQVIIDELYNNPRQEPPMPEEPTQEISQRPYSPEFIKAMIAEAAERKYARADPGNSGSIIASSLDAAFDGDKTKRYELCKWLVGVSSSKDMKGGQIIAIKNWLGVNAFNQVPDGIVLEEIKACLSTALMSAGQTKLPI